LFSGDTPVRLEKTAPFTEGDLTYTISKTTIQVKDRGKFTKGRGHLRRGDDEAVTFSFSAKLTDRTLRETLEDYIWDGQAFDVVGLTPQVNQTANLPYAYRQNSLQGASGEAIATKLANGATPSSDGEFAELVGALNSEGEIVEVNPGQFQVQPGAADTDMLVTFDAVGKSTLDPKGVLPPSCEADRRTLLIVLEKINVAREDKVDEVYELNHATLETVEQAEGDEFDLLTFTGLAYVTKVPVGELIEGPSADVIEVEIFDSIVVDDELEITFNDTITREQQDVIAVTDSIAIELTQ